MTPPRFDENPGFLEGVEDLSVEKLAARRASFDNETAILEQCIAQIRELAAGYSGQIAAQYREIALLAEEIGDIRP